MPAAEPPTPATPSAIALAFARIEALRAAGYDLLYPLPGELARLRRGRELVIVPTQQNERGVP